MAKVRVPAPWLQQGSMPRICARHGIPATRLTKRPFYTRTPAWVIIIVLLSLLVGLIVALAIRKTVHAQLPVCQICDREHKQYVLVSIRAGPSSYCCSSSRSARTAAASGWCACLRASSHSCGAEPGADGSRAT